MSRTFGSAAMTASLRPSAARRYVSEPSSTVTNPRVRDAGRVKDWLAWHEGYDDPSSSLARRLQVVRRRLGAVLDTAAGKGPQLLSLCAGDGRDVIPVLAAQRASPPVSAHLIECDEELSRRAMKAASSSGLGTVEVRCADAGDPASFSDVLPVDVLLLCGIFGNIEHGRVKDVIDVVPHLLAKGGYVIWTRGASDPDRRPEVRSWFRAAGLAEVSFDGAPETFGVGVNQRLSGPDRQHRLPSRLFSFVQG
jgi:hypothetical protein